MYNTVSNCNIKRTQKETRGRMWHSVVGCAAGLYLALGSADWSGYDHNHGHGFGFGLAVDAFELHAGRSCVTQSMIGCCRSTGSRSCKFLHASSRKQDRFSTSTVTRPKRKSSLSMHMGHSHSHHHHSHEERDSHGNGHKTTAMSILKKKGWKGKLQYLVTRRTTSLILFAAMAILGPPLLRHNQRLKRADVAVFALTCSALTFADAARREVKRILLSVRDLRDGLVKHAPPAMNMSSLSSYTLQLLSNTKDNTSTSTTAKQSTQKAMANANSVAADRVTILGAITNLILSLAKVIVGVTCHSSALIADAGHSLSDLFSDFITLWAVQVARLPPDDDHPYGHGKFEAVGSLFLALTLFGTGLSVGAVSNRNLMRILAAQRHATTASSAVAVAVPTLPALIVAGISIASKEWLYRITRRVGESLNSQVVIANAWHHRSDAYSSVLALISIGLAMAVPSMLAADSAAGLLVAGMICTTGAEILGDSVKQLTDASDESLVERVTHFVEGYFVAGEENDTKPNQSSKRSSSKRSSKTANAMPKDTIPTGENANAGDVVEVKRVRARQMGSNAIVDVTIATPEQMSSSATRAVEERVRRKIMDREPNVIDVDVHAVSAAVVCPLLLQTNEMDVEKDGVVNDVAARRRSPHAVEDDARNILLRHQEVASVERCTVHYRDTMTVVNVDANIQLRRPHAVTVANAMELAKDLKGLLEDSESIDSASIFLDLNSNLDSDLNLDLDLDLDLNSDSTRNNNGFVSSTSSSSSLNNSTLTNMP